MDVAFGLIGGLALSVLFWWFMTHFIVPKLVFSSGISKDTIVAPDATIYRCKFENSGRRAIIDISLKARIILPRYSLRRRKAGRVNTIIDVPLDTDHLFILKPKANRIVWLDIHEIEISLLDCLEASLVDKVRGRHDGALEGLLTIRDDAYIYVQALASTS
jgi:hypothetical protein